LIINHCVHPDYREALRSYFKAACAKGGHTPHVLSKALSWHINLQETGSMQAAAVGV
jgi:succinyl-CoA:acetate CoA-transferase